MTTEYVSVKDCTVYHGHGGFVIRSEMSCGVRNIEDINMTDIEKDAIVFQLLMIYIRS